MTRYPNAREFVAAYLAALMVLNLPLISSTSAIEIAARLTGLPADQPLPGETDKLVLRAQQALAKAGFYKGPKDGRNSKATTAAVRAYQAKAGLRVTGRITKHFLEGLENSL